MSSSERGHHNNRSLRRSYKKSDDEITPKLETVTFEIWPYFDTTDFQQSSRSIHVTTGVNLLGAFELLRGVRHSYLAQYVDICRAPRERINIVQEHCRHVRTTTTTLNELLRRDYVEFFYWLVDAVESLHKLGVYCLNISPEKIAACPGNRPVLSFKLIDYGLFYLKCNGLVVQEPFFNAEYLAPEFLDQPRCLEMCPQAVDMATLAAADVWSIALTVLCIILGRQPHEFCTFEDSVPADAEKLGDSSTPSQPSEPWFSKLLRLSYDESAFQCCEITSHYAKYADQRRSEAGNGKLELADVFRDCLTRDPSKRPTISQLKNRLYDVRIEATVNTTCALPCALQFLPDEPSALLLQAACQSISSKCRMPLDELFLDELYYLWKISGGSVAAARGTENSNTTDAAENEFSILSIPAASYDELQTVRATASEPGTIATTAKPSSRNVSGSLSHRILNIDRIESKLYKLPHAYYPIVAQLKTCDMKELKKYADDSAATHCNGDNNNQTGFSSRTNNSGVVNGTKNLSLLNNNRTDADFAETSSEQTLPVTIRERNVFYTYHRLVLFRHLLQYFPFCEQVLWNEAKIDIPPLYRGQTWAALLGVKCSAAFMFDLIDKTSPTSADRQIEVDVPRCHQYEPLLCSPAAHEKFKRILKAWVRSSHPHYVYWQGLDSLCAPFLYLNFSNEALAFECLRRFIDKYLAGFFIPDNTDVIHEYLSIFQHLVAFHDPQLAYHLHLISFQAELFAIPWFLTCFAHILPLSKLFILWDALLLADSTFPLFIGLALLSQMRTKLLQLGFNECILLFTDLPDVDIEKIRADAWQYWASTPKSIAVRNLIDYKTNSPQTTKRSPSSSMKNGMSLKHIVVETLRAEVCPRILLDDLLTTPEYEKFIGPNSLPYSVSKHLRLCARNNNNSNNEFPSLIIIDIRSPEDYARGSLACSVNIPFNELPVNNVINYNTSTDMVMSKSMSSFGFGSGLIVHARGAGYLRLLGQFDDKLKVVIDSAEKRAAEFALKLLSYNFSRVCVMHDGIESCRGRVLLSVIDCA